MRPLKFLVAVVAVVGLTFGLAACGGDSATVASSADTPAAAAGTTVAIELGEKGTAFFITADKATVPAGQVTFAINNVGTMHHEFAIFKTDLAADALPVDAEGKVDEDKAGLLEEAVYATPVRGDPDHRIRDGRGANFTIDLKPGKYVLLCNLTGHYKAGQYISFTVT